MSKLYSVLKVLHEINEAFDFNNIESLRIKKVNDTTYKSDDGSVEIIFQKVPIKDQNKNIKYSNFDDFYNVTFTVHDIDTQAFKTNYEEFIRILKAVKNAVDNFVKTNRPEVLLFMSMDKSGQSIQTDSQKDKLYKYAVVKNLPIGYGFDYDVKPFNFTDMKGIVLYRKDIKLPIK